MYINKQNLKYSNRKENKDNISCLIDLSEKIEEEQKERVKIKKI